MMNKLVVGLGLVGALAFGPVAVAVAQGGIVPSHPSTVGTQQAKAAESTAETEPPEAPESAATESETEATDPTTTETAPTGQPQAAAHTFTHGLPGALAGSAAPGDGFGTYVSGINKTGAPGAVASTMGKGKRHH